jgi:VanZ family protein
MTKLVFRLLSVGYVAGIFLLADSSVVSDLAPFNPYSLLHIPLYGILTLLLFLSISFSKPVAKNSVNSTNSTYSTRFLIVGLVATMIGVTDEIHQAYIPGRNASVVDVFLDMVGVGLCLLVVKRLG